MEKIYPTVLLIFLLLSVFSCKDKKPIFVDWKVQQGFPVKQDSIKLRLLSVIENRNFFFKETTRKDAQEYLYSKTKFEGLGQEQINALEKKMRINFPADFKIYLKHFGKNCGDLFFCGQDLEVSKLIDYQQMAKDLLRENGIEGQLDKNSFVFEFHRGYAFSFFKQEENDSLKVYQYEQGNAKPKIVYRSFGEMLEEQILNIERVHENSKTSDGYFIMINNEMTRMEYPAKDSGIVPRLVGDVFLDD